MRFSHAGCPFELGTEWRSLPALELDSGRWEAKSNPTTALPSFLFLLFRVTNVITVTLAKCVEGRTLCYVLCMQYAV